MAGLQPSNLASCIREAYDRIRADVRRTPVELSEPLSLHSGARVFVKWESDQATGSFKLRGALNKVRRLSADERARGVVTASTGNHGLAMARASKLGGVDLLLFLPETASEVKRKRLRELGITTTVTGATCDRTEAHARRFAASEGRIFVSPYNDWDIVCGAGTVGLEIDADLPSFDDVLVPIGGGGLIGGIAAWLHDARPRARTIGVEPVTSAFMAASLAAGRLVEIDEGETIADAVAGGIEPGAITFPLCRDLVSEVRTVPESAIGRAMALLHESHGRVVEGAGALPVAALLAAPGAFRGRTVVVVVSGGNIAPDGFRAATGLDVPEGGTVL
jgi:threonine dehydratase